MTGLWTVRTDAYTLQLVMPTPAGAITATRIAAASCTSAKVEVWLLKDDGSQVNPVGQRAAEWPAHLRPAHQCL